MSGTNPADDIVFSAFAAEGLDENWQLEDADVDLPDDAGDRWVMLARIQRWKRAVTAAEKAMKQAFGSRLDPTEATRFGNEIWQVGQKTHVEVNPALADWLGDDWQAVVKLSPASIRLTGLDAVAKQRGQDPRAVRDTFIWKEKTSELEVKSVPVTKAPKYQQRLEHGESVELYAVRRAREKEAQNGESD